MLAHMKVLMYNNGKNARSLTQSLVEELGQAIVGGVYSKENPFY